MRRFLQLPPRRALTHHCRFSVLHSVKCATPWESRVWILILCSRPIFTRERPRPSSGICRNSPERGYQLINVDITDTMSIVAVNAVIGSLWTGAQTRHRYNRIPLLKRNTTALRRTDEFRRKNNYFKTLTSSKTSSLPVKLKPEPAYDKKPVSQ